MQLKDFTIKISLFPVIITLCAYSVSTSQVRQVQTLWHQTVKTAARKFCHTARLPAQSGPDFDSYQDLFSETLQLN